MRKDGTRHGRTLYRAAGGGTRHDRTPYRAAGGGTRHDRTLYRAAGGGKEAGRGHIDGTCYYQSVTPTPYQPCRFPEKPIERHHRI